MTGRTALAIAAILHDYGRDEVNHEVEAILLHQREEIARLNHDRSRMLELLAIIHRDGGQYAAEHGIEKACGDAGAQVVTWLETIKGVDALIEQARLAEHKENYAEIDRLKKQSAAYATLTKSQDAQLSHLRAKEDEFRVAIANLDSEREANERLTQEVRDLQSLAAGMQAADDSLRAERDAAVA